MPGWSCAFGCCILIVIASCQSISDDLYTHDQCDGKDEAVLLQLSAQPVSSGEHERNLSALVHKGHVVQNNFSKPRHTISMERIHESSWPGNQSFDDWSHAFNHEEKEVFLIQRSDHKMGAKTIIVSVVVILLILSGVLHCVVGHVVGGILEIFICGLGPQVLGVGISFDSLRVHPIIGRVHIVTMIISNPAADPPYTCPHLFQADDVVIEINLKALLLTSMSTVDIQVLALRGVHVFYEKPSSWSAKSNLDALLAYVRGKKKKKRQAAKEEKETENVRKFFVHKLLVENVGAEAKVFGGDGISIDVPPINCEDLSKDCDGTGIDDIVLEVFEKFAESLLSSVEKSIKGVGKKLSKCAGKVCG
mmetsp:Transcript_157162/g.286171  ORF Transcript_157162/g.286171 Transcript_157162/m.286171 type:complete len:363 (-) Transcript_157162:97-1185(-)